jgi:hypothetical protein
VYKAVVSDWTDIPLCSTHLAFLTWGATFRALPENRMIQRADGGRKKILEFCPAMLRKSVLSVSNRRPAWLAADISLTLSLISTMIVKTPSTVPNGMTRHSILH